MLKRTIELRTQVGKLLDAALFGLAFWLAHTIRASMDGGRFFDSVSIPPFSGHLWLYAFILPATPVVLEVQGFYLHAGGVSLMRPRVALHPAGCASACGRDRNG